MLLTGNVKILSHFIILVIQRNINTKILSTEVKERCALKLNET